MEKSREFISILLKEHINGYSVTGTNGLTVLFDEICDTRADAVRVIDYWANKEIINELEKIK